ncbi:hypothetical protein ERICV_02003 [Paenibacillus larvae subsp. larvae]|uniref:Uncharacterized protein n=1 Tax=Paenibacillus larvae subsp. larvae TaxID=147375 RepID=A0A6C0QRM1_9BACL|nr:hypothetical protein ERICV_02003 [Paenibacillus larvae subsp. larvae]
MNFREMLEDALFVVVIGGTAMVVATAWVLLLSWLKVVIS